MYHGPITSRVVRRWFYRNKSYGTKLAAYMRAAKDELWLELAGEDYDYMEGDWEALYSAKFPASKCPEPRGEPDSENCDERRAMDQLLQRPAWHSCIHNLRAHLKERARKLMDSASESPLPVHTTEDGGDASVRRSSRE